MANKKIKHIVAKLLGEATEETLDIYDESALHATDIVDNLTSTDATKVLSAKQGKALNDSIGTVTSRLNNTLILPSLTNSAKHLKYVTVTTFDDLLSHYGDDYLTIFDVYSSTGSPGGANHWSGIQWLNSPSTYGVQLTLSFGSDNLYIRRRNNSLHYTEWKAIT